MKPTIIIRRGAAHDIIKFVKENAVFDVHALTHDPAMLKKLGSIANIRHRYRELVVNSWARTNGYALIYPE